MIESESLHLSVSFLSLTSHCPSVRQQCHPREKAGESVGNKQKTIYKYTIFLRRKEKNIRFRTFVMCKK